MDEIEQRYYQEESIDNGIRDLNLDCDPVIALPTGSGKSIVLCGLAERIIDQDVNAHVLVLSHVKEILLQNLKALEEYFYGMEMGLYCSGLKSKTIKKITVASIQTAQNNIGKFEHFTHVIIDEAHRVAFDKKTGYRKFIDAINARCIGLTATPFRMKGGYIYEGDDSLFDKLSIDLTSGDNFTRLIEEGYLSEIYSKKTLLKLDEKGLKTIAGDFSSKDLSNKFDRLEITRGAILECLHFGKKYFSWLCFAIDIKHAENIVKIAIENGISAVAVHSKMDGRDEAIKGFKEGKYRLLVNVDILTTGFDFPAIDLIIMLRHTKSPIVHVQTIGRGLRVLYAKGYATKTKEQRLLAIKNSKKTHCLVLDFAGNSKRLGPINDVLIREVGERKKGSGARTKTCPSCDFDNYLQANECCNCEHQFLIKQKIESKACEEDLVKKGVTKKSISRKLVGWAKVKKVTYRKYVKFGNDIALICDYHCGLVRYSEYIFVNGRGYSQHRANAWIKLRWMNNSNIIPSTVNQCIVMKDYLDVPKKIMVDTGGKFVKVLKCEF